jgi:tryptophanyl-tRNA synthetase
MSKSYDNTIPLFAPRAELKKAVFSIVTDSRAPGEPKPTEGSALFQLYQAFADRERTAAFAQAFADGIGWGDAKQALFETIDAAIAPMREKYEALVARPADIEDTLQAGAAKARRIATPFMAELRAAVGLRDLRVQAGAASATKAKAALPQFKQYRDDDGRFRFKLVDGDGRELLLGAAHGSPREAGQLIARLRADAAPALRDDGDGRIAYADAPLGALAAGADLPALVAALDALRAADPA